MTDVGAGFDALSAGAGPVARGSVARVGFATAITAACGYAVLYLAARNLDPAGFSVFGVFWGAFGLVTGAANGLLQESTREVRAAVGRQVGSDGPQTHPMRVAAGVGLAAAAVIASTSPLWAPHVFVEARGLSVVLLSIGLGGFCLHATLLGMLAGTGQWTQYGSLMVTDAVIRVAIATATFLLGWGLSDSSGRQSVERWLGSWCCRCPPVHAWLPNCPRPVGFHCFCVAHRTRSRHRVRARSS